MLHVQNITTLFVSQKSGSDDNQGFFPENNCMMTGPVRTIEHALAIIAELRVFGVLQPIQIKIMDETYLLDKTLRINNSVNSVTIAPYTKTLLCGGTKIDWFAEDCFNGSKCLSADLSTLGEINFSDFYINNRRAAVTRYPQVGVLRPEDVEDHSTELGAGSRWFVAKEEDFEKIKSFKNVENCIVSFNHYWVDEHSPIKSIDPTTRKVTIGYPGKETGASQMMFFHNNLFFDTKREKRDKPQVIQIGKKSYSFSEYKEELGIDVGGIYADPEFEDIENFVFHIRENSPAFQIGFQQIDLSDVGPRN